MNIWLILWIVRFLISVGSHGDSVISCTTPNGEPGICVSIRNCPQLLEQIYANYADRKNLYRNYSSSCNSYVKSFVCCSTMEKQNCGVAPMSSGFSRIVGGEDAAPGEWPWLALLGYRSKIFKGPYWMCGGTVINDRFILTAAHCVTVNGLFLFVIRLGESDRSDPQRERPTDYLVDSFIVHENFLPNEKLNDIALVKLQKKIIFTDRIQPICLPELPGMKTNSFVHYFPFIAGWGQISTDGDSSMKLQQTQVPVVNNDYCNETYGDIGYPIIDRQICAGFAWGGRDACQGDSGGPLMLPVNNSFYVIGVISYGLDCARPGYPGVYTRVTSYIDWIKSLIE